MTEATRIQDSNTVVFLKRLRWKHGTLKAKSHRTVWSPEKKEF